MFSPIANTFLEFQKKYSEDNNYIDTYLASNNGNYAEKKFDKDILSVELLELISKTKPTTQGGNGEWGYNKSKLWVNRGLRANFRIIFEEKDENITELKNKVTALEKRITELEKPTKVEPNVESKCSSELTEEQTSKIKEVLYKLNIPADEHESWSAVVIALYEQNWNVNAVVKIFQNDKTAHAFCDRNKERLFLAQEIWRKGKYLNLADLNNILRKDKTINNITDNVDKLWQQEQKENTPIIICFCGKAAVHLRVVSNTRNKNRAYCSCKTRSCQFFSWKEGPVAQQSPHSNNIPYNPYN